MINSTISKFLCAFCLIASFGTLKAQTVVYDIPNTQLVGMMQTDPFGDWCFMNDWEQISSVGGIWGMDWTSVNLGTVTSITVEMRYSNEEGNGPYDVIFNGNVETTFNPPQMQCTMQTDTIIFTPTVYNSGAINQFRLDYTPGGQTHYMQPNGSWGGAFYARVTVEYGCVPSTSTDEQVACDSYTWIDGNTYTSSTSTPKDTLVSATGCDSIVTLNLTINSADTSVTQTGTTLMANGTGSTYQWVTCPGMSAIAGDTNQTFVPSADGDYAVIVNNNGCIDTSACISVTGVGIIENSFGENFKLFPNPTIQDQLTINLGDTYSSVLIEIIDLQGKIVQRVEDLNASNIQFDFNHPAGQYLIKIVGDENVANLKLLKQ